MDTKPKAALTLDELAARVEALEKFRWPTIPGSSDALMTVYRKVPGGFLENKMPAIDAHVALKDHPGEWVEEIPPGAKILSASEVAGEKQVVVPPGSVRADGQAPTTAAPIAPAPVVADKNASAEGPTEIPKNKG